MLLSRLDKLSDAFAVVVDGLSDPARRRRVALAVVAAYAAAWWLYGVIAKSSQDINADMAEMVVWAREPALGYPKHPPLLAFVVKLWFAVFPLTDWAYMLLSMVTVGAGIFLAIELCGVWLDGDKRAATPFVLALIPFYNFFGLKFDQNSALIPLWALAMWALMRSLNSRSAGWAALAGLAAAAAMLTKYWSGFLLAGMALTVLLDCRRDAYWRSAAPWITASIFLLTVAPHVVWLVHENFPPLTWVETRRTAHSGAEFLRSLSEYTFGTIGYSAVALIAGAALLRPSGAAVRDSWWPWEPVRRPATILFWTPLALPIVIAIALRIALLSLWNSPALGLLPVMMLASPLVAMPRLAVMRLAALATAVTLTALAASPLVALIILRRGVENNAEYARLAAAAVEDQWRQTASSPLRLVAGPFALVNPVAFYVADRPSTFSDFSGYLSPWVSETRIARDGVAIICPAQSDGCIAQLDALTAAGPAGRRSEVTLTRHWLGFAGPPRRFVIATVPPRP